MGKISTEEAEMEHRQESPDGPVTNEVSGEAAIEDALRFFVGPGYKVTVENNAGVVDVSIEHTSYFVHRLDQDSLRAQCETEHDIKTLAQRLVFGMSATIHGAAAGLKGRGEQIV